MKSCDRCQFRDSIREKKALHSIWILCLWKKIAVDVMHMFMNHEKSFLIVARNDLSEWIEIQFFFAANVDKIFDFLWKNVICRHDCFEKLIIDDEFENRGWIANLFEKYDSKRVMISTYHFQTNDMMKKKHKFLIDALSKMSADDRDDWVKHLSTVLWTDRSTVKISTEKTPYFLLCENESILFIEIKHFIWKILLWEKVRSISDLLVMRARQLKKKKEDMTQTVDMMRRMRKQNKELFDDYHEIRNKEIKEKNMIFLHNTQHEKNKNSQRKLNYKWKNLYRIIEVIVNKNIYFLIELNDIDLKSTFADNRFKKFRLRLFSDVEKIEISFEINVENIFEKNFEIENKIFDFDSFADFRKNLIFFEWSLIVIVFFFFNDFDRVLNSFCCFSILFHNFQYSFYFNLFFFFFIKQCVTQISCAVKSEKLKNWNLFCLKIVNLSINSVDEMKVQFFIWKKCNFFCRIF